jgi:xanthine dehydrogenase accessory factor
MTGRPEVFIYDTTGDESSVFSMNMGCRGVIRILLEAVDRENLLIERLARALEMREPQFMATLVEASSDEHPIGGRAFLNESLGFEIYGLSPLFEKIAYLPDALAEFARSGSAYAARELEMPQGRFEFIVERISPPVSLLIFGAGADAVPLARMAAELGWQATVHDHRPAYLTVDRFPTARHLELQPRNGLIPEIAADNLTAAVVMTHNYDRDRSILPSLLGSEAFYVGVLGPKSRTQQLLDEVEASGQVTGPVGCERLYAPVGLDIGASTPEGIALAILAEIQTILGRRPGGHLRDREGSIYDRT